MIVPKAIIRTKQLGGHVTTIRRLRDGTLLKTTIPAKDVREGDYIVMAGLVCLVSNFYHELPHNLHI